MIELTSPRFHLGQLVATPGAIRALDQAGITAWSLVSRHLSGDWGDCDKQDRQANEDALIYGDRVFSAYALPTGEKLWVVTEADRRSTCVLTPEEY